ncbi:MAG: cyclic nucleotide-binding domain-containing protein, partial [Chitinophagaceae bacterium]|nr:cyclic nucleotide-binding domain-containing protein [Chitinophagaceae bacterium]
MQTTHCDLKSCFLCSQCLPDWRELIAQKKQTLIFKKGARIFSEGDRVNGIYFIYEGSAKVHLHWDAEKDVILRFARQGDVLGHRGLGERAVYPISATTLEPAKVC